MTCKREVILIINKVTYISIRVVNKNMQFDKLRNFISRKIRGNFTSNFNFCKIHSVFLPQRENFLRSCISI